ncbi:MAG: hypothetical protein P8L18_07590 [Verrucomicrobiota bacterium]|nr:hypothetical protein [Verrucomicrobiota bacterium]
MTRLDMHGFARRLQPLLLKAYLWSILMHCSLIGSVELLHHYGITDQGILSTLTRPETPDLVLEEPLKELEIKLEKEPEPTHFFDADPSLASEEKPENTPYYAVIDALAGNPDTSMDLDRPKLEGSQERVLKTSDTSPSEQMVLPEPEISPLQPSPEEILESPPAEMEMTAEEPVLSTEEALALEPVEAEEEQPADLALPLQPSVAPAPPKAQGRPLTLAEAKQRKGILIGESIQQEGGVKRFRLESSPDLLGTPFGAYDAAIIQAIQQRWFRLLGDLPSARNASGKVVMKFDLMSDGRVQELEVEEDTVGIIQSLLCQRAISDPAPYGPWPRDMRRMVGEDHRNIRFTFYYN